MQAILLALAFSVAQTDGAKDDEVAKELVKLQGIWKATAVEMRGSQFTAGRLSQPDRLILAVVGNEFAFNSYSGTLKLDPAQATADLVITAGMFKGMTGLGRYELKGDTLRMVLTNPLQTTAVRPAEVKTNRTDQVNLYTVYIWEKDAKATKEQAADQLKSRKEAILVEARTGGGTGSRIGDGPPTRGGAGGTDVPPPPPASSAAQLFRQINERLDRMEKRLDDMEKRLTTLEKK